jgi:hypothetical protein
VPVREDEEVRARVAVDVDERDGRAAVRRLEPAGRRRVQVLLQQQRPGRRVEQAQYRAAGPGERRNDCMR